MQKQEQDPVFLLANTSRPFADEITSRPQTIQKATESEPVGLGSSALEISEEHAKQRDVDFQDEYYVYVEKDNVGDFSPGIEVETQLNEGAAFQASSESEEDEKAPKAREVSLFGEELDI
jgi:hypothetical protein